MNPAPNNVATRFHFHFHWVNRTAAKIRSSRQLIAKFPALPVHNELNGARKIDESAKKITAAAIKPIVAGRTPLNKR